VYRWDERRVDRKTSERKTVTTKLGFLNLTGFKITSERKNAIIKRPKP